MKLLFNKLTLIAKLANPIVFAYLLIACEAILPKAVENRDHKPFFDVETFIKTQIELLNEYKPKIAKKLKINDMYDSITTRKVNWNKELAIFLQADINKPAWKNSFNKQEQKNNWGTQITYQATEKQVPVQKLTILVDTPRQNIISLEAILLKDNYFYVSEKKISFKSKKFAQNRYMLVEYAMSGYQRISFFGKETYSFQAVIIH
ncbi:MAG: hypothetical protein NZ551_07285 [Microscillaceae bacterium]|nr:hypothetical protein [Microscillaceae bacterium]MDW8460997.1 hypothetical protein [Cytophagales bacterium]